MVIKKFLCMVLFLCLIASVACAAENGGGGVSTTLNGHKYHLFNLSMTWSEAKKYCEDLGGHLATITSEEEQDVIEVIVIEGGNKNSYWLGGQRDLSNNWEWIDDNVWGYTNWASGQPDNDFEDKLMMYRLSNPAKPSEPGTWNDLQNDGTHGTETFFGINNIGFICEWETVSADFAPYSEEYEKWLDDPEGYFEGMEFYGHFPEALDLSHLADNVPEVDTSEIEASTFVAAALPALYDPRTNGKLSAVRNQGSYGTCWAFASLGALEINYLKQNLGANPDLSELHLAWFVYKDPRPKYSFPLNSFEEHVLDQGGNPTKSISFLSRAGVTSESELEYYKAANVETLTKGKYPEDYPHPMRLKEGYFVDKITTDNRDTVKSLIYHNGAVLTAFKCDQGRGFSSNHHSYYYPFSGGGHEIILVGWDDNYSKNNFTGSYKPSSNGAWLAKNSWGTNWGDGGYFWLSYEQYLYNSAVYIAAVQSNSIKIKGYDNIPGLNTMNYHWSANIFTTDETETLKEVGFYTADNNVPYEVYVIKLGTGMPVNPGTPSTSNRVAKGTMPYAGYHSITLEKPVTFNKGVYFSVIVKAGSASKYPYYSAVEDSGGIAASSVNVGTSYFARDETIPTAKDWKDGVLVYYNSKLRPSKACVKAISVPNAGTPVPDDPPEPEPEPDDPPEPSNNHSGGGCSAGFGVAGLMIFIVMISKIKFKL